MNEMMANLIPYFDWRYRCAHAHFPEYLTGIAGDNFCVKIAGYLNAKCTLADPGGTNQDSQSFVREVIQKAFFRYLDDWN